MSALRVQQRVRWEVDPSGRWHIVTLGERAVRIENPEGSRRRGPSRSGPSGQRSGGGSHE